MIIDSLHSNYLLKRCRDKPSLIQRRLDKIAATILRQELEGRLSRIEDNGYLIFIKDININFKIDLSKMDDRVVGSMWAEHICSNVFERINSIPNIGNQILQESGLAFFPNEAVYFAHFIRDVTEGAAWGKWYYKRFEGLENLGTQEILKLLFRRSGQFACDILLSLEDMGAFEKFIQSLTDETAEEIYLKHLRESSRLDIRLGSRKYQTELRRVNKFIHTSRKNKSEYTPGISKSYKQCLQVLTLFLKEYPQHGLDINIIDIIADIILGKKKYEAEEKIESDDGDFIDIDKDDEKEKHILKTSLEDPLKKEIRSRDRSDEKVFETLTEFKTYYGGLFLLVPAIVKIGLDELVAKSRFPYKGNLSPLNYFLFFLGMKIAGEDLISNKTNDYGIYLLAGLDIQVPFNTLENYRSYINPDLNLDFLRKMKKKLEEMKARSFSCLDYISLDDLKRLEQKGDFDAVIKLTTELVLRVFSRDLRGFEESSSMYLFRNFIERESKIKIKKDIIFLNLGKKPLDTVLRLSGLLDYELRVPWLNYRTIEFTLEQGV